MRKTPARNKTNVKNGRLFLVKMTLLTAFGLTWYGKRMLPYSSHIEIWEQALWIEGVLIGLCFAIPFLCRYISGWFYAHSSLKRIDRMSGEQFEQYLAAKFKQQGYKVEKTEKSWDYGADLILTKHRKKIVVQAKRYNKTVGNNSVQQVCAAIRYYGADAGMVCTNSYFTSAAKKLAERNEIRLIDREGLKKL